MKFRPSFAFFLFIPLLASLGLTGCLTSQQWVEVGTKAQQVATEIADIYETANIATGGNLTTAILQAALAKSHNTNATDEAYAAVAASLANQALLTQYQAQQKALPQSAVQASISNKLSSQDTINSAAAVAPASDQSTTIMSSSVAVGTNAP